MNSSKCLLFVLLATTLGCKSCPDDTAEPAESEEVQATEESTEGAEAEEPEDPLAVACAAAVATIEGELAAMLERASTIAPDSDAGVITMPDLRRRPMPDGIHATLFGSVLPTNAAVLQAQVSVTPPEENRSFALMHQTSIRSSSTRRFPLEVAEHSLEARAGTSTNMNTEIDTQACWFDIEVEREGGGTYGVGVTLAIQ